MVDKGKVLDEKSNRQGGHLTCKAKDIGMSRYLVCLGKSKEEVTCEHRFIYGFDHLCCNPVRMEQERGRA
jgi:hypothetical protein